MSLPFETSSKVYDLLYKDKDYAAEAEFIHGKLVRAEPSALHILELGSGTGLHSLLLARKGHVMDGVDLSAGMVARANQLKSDQPDQIQSKINFHVGDVRSFNLGAKVDAVVSLFHVVSYQPQNHEVVEMFQNAREHLNKGGLFLFDFWYGPALLADLPAVRIKRAQDQTMEVTRLCEPEHHVNSCRVDVHYTYLVRDLKTNDVLENKETHRMRYFFLPELEHFLTNSGFRLADSFEWLTGNTLSSRTFGACIIAEAM
jgi:SAM-dependent methyltransferase